VWTARSIRAARGTLLRLGGRLCRAALTHMGGDQLSVDAGGIDDGEPGDERNEDETPNLC
jgi:hypothetical protein